MLKPLAVPFATLERQKRAVLEDLTAFRHELCQFRPRPEQWSATDVIEHLVKSERGILSQVRAALNQSGGVRTVPVSDRLRGCLLTALFRTPFRVRVPPAAASVLPSQSAGLDELSVEWSACREQLAELLERIETPDLAKAVFRHPVTGWMTLPRVLQFFSAHIQHHGYQIERLKVAGNAANWQA